jgi:2-desacetyl-2-hydroxyethyl bacteriochlorophyllide A dehydrogenase
MNTSMSMIERPQLRRAAAVGVDRAMPPPGGRMRCLVCYGPGEARLVDAARPDPGPGEVLLRVRRVGLCGEELDSFLGPDRGACYPRVPGQTVAGDVVSAPPESGLLPGGQVYAMPYLRCGSCPACRQGDASCRRTQVLGVHRDGSIAEYVAVPAESVYRTDGISMDDAAMLGSLAKGAHAVRRAGIRSGQRVLVMGAGASGIATALFASLKGALVTLLDDRAERLNLCRSMLGLEGVLTGQDDVAKLWRLTSGNYFDVVLDASGDPATIERGFGFVAHGGTYVLATRSPGRICIADAEFNRRETTLIASHHPTLDDFRTALEALKAGRVPTRSINTHRATLSSLTWALPQWMQPASGVIQAIVEI